jgi:hypothetical protein
MNTNVENNQLQITEQNPQNLIALAIQNGSNIEQLEKLMALKERWDATIAKKSFLAAMASFQNRVPTIQKKKLVNYSNKAGGVTNYKFAELGEIDETIKETLSNNGLSKRWEIAEQGDNIICTCIISHVDGHSEKTTMSSVKDGSGGKNEIQSRASAVSYLQRYTLIGALGLTTASEDNDGDGTPPQKTYSQQQPQQSQQQNNVALEWLNVTDKQGKKTELGIQIINEIASGETTIQQLRTRFKISKDTAELLGKVKVGDPLIPTVLTTHSPEQNPFEIPGHWYAKMEKCKTKNDVLAIYHLNKETIDANKELQALLKETQQKLPA